MILEALPLGGGQVCQMIFTGGKVNAFDEKNIKFMGDQIRRNETLSFVDEVLREKGILDDHADYSCGLTGLADSFMIHIIDDDDSFVVKLESLSGQNEKNEFVIDKETRTIYRSMMTQDQHLAEDDSIDFLEDL